jgi:hypothetical protein
VRDLPLIRAHQPSTPVNKMNLRKLEARSLTCDT